MNEGPSVLDIAKMIDHSLLHPTMTDAEVREGLKLSRDCRCATACIKPYHVPMASELLAGSDVGVCAVAGFPHGNSHTRIKVLETELAIDEGATEIDTVVNNGKVLGGDWDYVRSELRAINEACVGKGAILKVIFENDFLREEQIVRLCEICTELQVAFVKTSTGYGFVKQASGQYAYQGATLGHLKLMRERSGSNVQVKAAGGVRTLDDTLKVRELGVTRIGATATVAILQEAVKRGFPGPVPVGVKSADGRSGPSGY
ncbi:deoxyribose-phosphate aldolase [Pelagicoccus sp. SDUM812003]|uniref:deoxyribose-phosphate aldolase n=1 Tax=Pelagicoccus sp. SDUM812003 TaxID=3041267 RepID=UPI00280C7BE1|nr:deoxyribose-phosphate aldolase [Pelagicoccus sp. SDUM812003]MDQ8205593.1 deoxyribose-phosphate aldolase [Pelagicoccus sp. SDUM812003]